MTKIDLVIKFVKELPDSIKFEITKELQKEFGNESLEELIVKYMFAGEDDSEKVKAFLNYLQSNAIIKIVYCDGGEVNAL